MGSKAEAGWVWADRPRISRLGTERERPFIVTLTAEDARTRTETEALASCK